MQKVRQLVDQFQPAHYTLDLDVRRQTRRFSGAVVVQGYLPYATNGIILHARGLMISEATIDDMPAKVSSGKDDELTLQVSETLARGDHEVKVVFAGRITDSLHGLYASYYNLEGKKKELLMTQFESHYAREVFPCIDEPAAKATFELSVEAERGVDIVSNTPAVKQSNKDTRQTVEFAKTPKMSTYLLAFVIGELEHIRAKTKGGTIIGGYATQGQAKHMQFAVDVAVQALDFLNDFFGVPYPLPKCDFVAVPDFSALAMENWGCVTGRESYLLADESESDISVKQYIVIVVIHELAHQWFGNLVTMEWWNDLWLNEGFARFMECYVADKLYPEWGIGLDFLAKKVSLVQSLDGLTSTHPVQFVINHPEEIEAAFDSISYEKGASTLAMLLNYVGEEAFRDGLRRYVRAHQYANAVTDDLWDALSDVSGKDVKAFMANWVGQPGYPVVTVSEKGDGYLLRQDRFFANPRHRQDDPTVWQIPLLANIYEMPSQLSTRTLKTEAIHSPEPLKLNKDQVGFYFTLYSDELRQRLNASILGPSFSVKDRLGLLNETFELARAGYLKTVEALKLIDSFSSEGEVHIWDVLSQQFGALRVLIDADRETLEGFNDYVSQFVRLQVEQLTWRSFEGESEGDRLKRKIVLSLACGADDVGAVMQARQLFENSKTFNEVPPDLRVVVYSSIVRNGMQADFDSLMRRYLKTDFAEERRNILMGLCATTSPDNVEKLLDHIRNNGRIQDLIYWLTELSINPVARPIMWKWLKKNWKWLTELYANDPQYTYLPRYTGRTFSKRTELADFQEFFEPKRKDQVLNRAIDQNIEAIDMRVQWRSRDYSAISRFFSGT
ncbi:MAG TPA: M1 family metallopeptidase [Candidatus Saccharimonadales bacterium]|nr:M1 family metallopeptidase [Candidatus Saccharimonadales bacterium]